MANNRAQLIEAEKRRGMTHTGSSGQSQSIEDMRANAFSNLIRAPGRLAQGISTGIVGAPVDIANMALTPFGLGSERPIGGSNSLAALINADTSSLPYQAGTMLPISPEGLAMGAKGIPMAMAGIFAGKGAKTANLKALMKAEGLKAQGIPDEQMRYGDGQAMSSPKDLTETFKKHGGQGDIDESLDIPAKSQAFADMAESEGFKVIGRGDKYVTLKKSFGKTPDGYDKEAIVKVRISDHSNVNRSTHFGEADINIAPDDGYSRDTFNDALEKLRRVDVNDDLDTVFTKAPKQPAKTEAVGLNSLSDLLYQDEYQ